MATATPKSGSTQRLKMRLRKGDTVQAVSYTHLTLPTT